MTLYAKARPRGGPYWGNDRISRGSYEPGSAHLGPGKRRRIRDAYAGGEMTATEIAEHFDTTPRSVLRIARAYGLAPKLMPIAHTPEQLQEAFDAFMDPYQPLQAAAKILGVSKDWARKILKRAGFELPKVKPWPKKQKYVKPKTDRQLRLALEFEQHRANGKRWAEIAALYQKPVKYCASTWAYVKFKHPELFPNQVDMRKGKNNWRNGGA